MAGRSDGTYQSFMDALRRLAAGRPTESRNVDLAARNRLRITIVSVAREARKSRTLIGSIGCPYPDVREEVLRRSGELADGSKKRRAGDTVSSLRAKNQKLQKDIRTLATRLNDAALRIDELERRSRAEGN